MKRLGRLHHTQPVELQTITTDRLASYGVALDPLDLRHLHRPGPARPGPARLGDATAIFMVLRRWRLIEITL